jgi:hypothetical protein
MCRRGGPTLTDAATVDWSVDIQTTTAISNAPIAPPHTNTPRVFYAISVKCTEVLPLTLTFILSPPIVWMTLGPSSTV